MLSAPLSATLQELARQHQLTLNTLVLGGWALVLSHYSGADDVVFGATTSGRPALLDGVESMIGLFINTLPIRVQLAPETPLLVWLGAIQDQLLDMRGFDYTPLAQIQSWSDAPAGTPLFESIVVFENYPVAAAVDEQEGALALGLARTYERTNYPLTLVGAPGEQLSLRLMYDPRRYTAETVGRLMAHLARMLRLFAEQPEQTLREIAPLDAALPTASAVERAAPPAQTLVELFAAQAARTPDAVALSDGARWMTYRELDERANQIAHQLIALGVAPDQPVAIFLDRTIELVVSIVAVLKAGGGYVPLDPTHPQDRLAFVLEDSGVTLVLTLAALEQSLPTGPARALRLDADEAQIAARSRSAPQVALTPQHLAYVIYTSGSTGKPKGVLVDARQRRAPVQRHRRLVRLRSAATSGRCSTPTPSTSRSGRSGARCSTAAGSSSCPTGSAARPRPSTSCWPPSASRCSTRRRRPSAS